MRYALIADIHANAHALDAVLADIDHRSDVDAIYPLGNLVGYSAFPNEVVACHADVEHALMDCQSER